MSKRKTSKRNANKIVIKLKTNKNNKEIKKALKRVIEPLGRGLITKALLQQNAKAAKQLNKCKRKYDMKYAVEKLRELNRLDTQISEHNNKIK